MNSKLPTGPISDLLVQYSGLSQFRKKNRKLFETLTDREVEVLELIASGLKNPAIAGELDISQTTVQNHRASIRDKLGITHQADYIMYGFAFELIQF